MDVNINNISNLFYYIDSLPEEERQSISPSQETLQRLIASPPLLSGEVRALLHRISLSSLKNSPVPNILVNPHRRD